jgi:hypothetical protein
MTDLRDRATALARQLALAKENGNLPDDIDADQAETWVEMLYDAAQEAAEASDE